MTIMHISHRQEAFSIAFVRAVAAAAGFRVQGGTKPDDDSVDLTIAARGPLGTIRSPKLDIQLKCLLGRPQDGPQWPYDLKVKNYEELRHVDMQVPRVLVVVVVPCDVAEWVEQDEERLLLRRCAWWVSLRGLPESENTETVRVYMPRSQVLDVDGLTAMMNRIGAGGAP